MGGVGNKLKHTNTPTHTHTTSVIFVGTTFDRATKFASFIPDGSFASLAGVNFDKGSFPTDHWSLGCAG